MLARVAGSCHLNFMQNGAQHHAALAASTGRISADPISRTARPKTVAIAQTQAENAGAQEVARQLAHGLEQRGWRVRQIFFFRRTESFDGDPNAVFCARRRPRSPIEIVKMLVELYKEIRREKPDAVISMQHYGNFFAAPVARLAGTPIVIANQFSPSELVPAPIRFADRLMGMLGLYDHIVTNSAQTDAAYRNYPKSYTKRLTRIDHGFLDKSAPMTKRDARLELGLPRDVELLGCAARLHPFKQLDFAIRAIAEDEAQHLALAGQGEDRERLFELATSLGVVDRVHFLGELSTAQMGAFLAALDCFVFPSANETFGLAAVEAAQAGVPTVVNDIEILREVLSVGDEPCALFADVRDPRAFAAAIRCILDDGALRETLTSRGRQLTQRYPLDAMIDQYARLMTPAAS